MYLVYFILNVLFRFFAVVYLEAFVALLLYYQSFTISFESQCYTLDSNIHF